MFENFFDYLILAAVLTFSVLLHEIAHGYSAHLMGDNTAKYMGRLSFNPLKHINRISAGLVLAGLLLSSLFPALSGYTDILIFIGFVTIAQPVPINAGYFKDPKKGMAFTAFAGPVTNILLAYISMFIIYALSKFDISSGYSNFAFSYLITINVRLAVLNMLPIPPLDGSKVLFAFLPQRLYFAILEYERYIQIALLVLLFMGRLDGLIETGTTNIINAMSQSAAFLLGIR